MNYHEDATRMFKDKETKSVQEEQEYVRRPRVCEETNTVQVHQEKARRLRKYRETKGMQEDQEYAKRTRV